MLTPIKSMVNIAVCCFLTTTLSAYAHIQSQPQSTTHSFAGPNQVSANAGQEASNKDFKKLTQYFDTLAKHDKLMGSVVLRQNGKTIYDYQFGFKDVANKQKGDSQTQYQIGSISKTYTAVMIMKLVEQGKLSLEQSLADFYPSVPNAKKITIHHLLRHESGIFNFTNSMDYQTYMLMPQTKAQLVKRIAAFEPVFVPGSKHEYSNSNYVLLGYIAEDVAKMPYDKLLASYIIEPLNLTRTQVGDGIDSEKNEAFSYKFTDEWQLETETDMSVPAGAGAISASAEDVAKFFDGLFTGKLISEESLNKMIKPKDYGYALTFMPFYDKVAYGHGGRIDGFTTNAAHIKSDNVSLALLSNGVNTNMNNAMIAILSTFYGKEFDIPEFKPKQPVGKFDLKDYVGLYATDKMPLKINVFIKDDTLMAQATGQGAFPLTPTAKDEFSFAPAGIVMQFHPKDKTFMLLQGGGEILFSLEE
jgi:D-alanyl-D-alanine carboxypeptidase